MKNEFKKHLLYFCFSVFIFTKLPAQNFREVSCKPIYETLSLGNYNNTLLYSSGVKFICNKEINSIGLWDGNKWDSVGKGADENEGGAIWVGSIFNNQLIIGGAGLYHVGGKLVNNIARWNGIEWNPLGAGLDEQLNSDQIRSLAVYKGELYAAGSFRRMNGVTGYNNIARWDGSTWHKVAGGVIRNGVGVEINSMLVYKGELYVAGYFDQAGVATAYNIARWDGITWKTLGNGGAWNGIYDLAIDTIRNVLYVGGDFNGVDSNIQSRKVAMWDGIQWQALPEPPLGSSVSALEMYHGYLYAGSMGPNHFARWDGQKWDSIPGVKGTIRSLQTYKNEIYLGGSFKKIGNDSIPYLARYYCADSVLVGMLESKKEELNLKVYPNPAEHEITIEYDASVKGQILLYNSLGQLINSFVLEEGKNLLKVETADLKAGLYLLCVKENGEVTFSAKKIIIQH